jgi:2-polyprenyl-6-methoxyphenol hydroxylase-like FAD-dependent oxidoreductase
MPHLIIVGAGPAGAALASLLARRDIEVTLRWRHLRAAGRLVRLQATGFLQERFVDRGAG